MIVFLTPEQILFIHNRLVEETGGSHGVRDIKMLLSAIGRPQAVFEGEDLYTDIYSKAAALMDSLVRNHPFLDANKRTAIASTALFLQVNGYRLVATDDEMTQFTMACAQSKRSHDEIAIWFEQNSRKM